MMMLLLQLLLTIIVIIIIMIIVIVIVIVIMVMMMIIITIRGAKLKFKGAEAGEYNSGANIIDHPKYCPTPGLHYKIPVFSDPAPGKS